MDPTEKLTADGLSVSGEDFTMLRDYCEQLLAEQQHEAQCAWAQNERAEIDTALPAGRIQFKDFRL